MEPTSTSAACTEFRYLLVRLARQLHSEDTEGLMFVHKITKPATVADVGLHVLSKLEAEGHFDPFSPEKLQDILSKIGRKDLSHDIKEYRQSGAFKKALKLEADREKELKRRDSKQKRKKGKDRGEGTEERQVAAHLLSGVELTTTREERAWRDMFALALTHTAQLVEQMVLLRKAIQDHRNPQTSSKRIEEALATIETAQDEVESLSKTLKKAISEAGLKSRRASQEGLLDQEEGLTESKPQAQPVATPPPSSPMLARARAHPQEGHSSPHFTRPRANTHDGTSHAPLRATPTAPVSSLATTHTASPAPRTEATPNHTPGPAPTSTQDKKSAPPPVKQKPVKRELGRVLADGSNSLTATKGATEASNAPTKQTGALTAAKPATNTNEPSTLTPPDVGGDAEEHVYEDPNKLPQEERDVYVNSSMVISSPAYQKEKQEGTSRKRVSNASLQDDSGLGSEDKSWGGELVNLKEKPRQPYVNLRILPEDEQYAELQGQETQTSSGEYTKPIVKPQVPS